MLQTTPQKDVKRKKMYNKKSDKRMTTMQTAYRSFNILMYQQALKLISSPFTECVKAPTDIKSTPHSA